MPFSLPVMQILAIFTFSSTSMAKASIQDITALPLTGLRYGLADKLLRINSQQRFAPVAPMQVDALLEQLEYADISINQLVNVQEKCKGLLELIRENKHVADKVHDLIISLRIIQADNRDKEELNYYLDLLIREWNANIFPAEELKFFLQELRAVSKDRTLEQEISNAQKAILEGQAPLDINLATPEKQLIWSAHLLFLLYNPYMMFAWPLARRKGAPNLVATGLWQQLLSCHHVRYLRVLFGTHVFNLTRNNKIQLTWGPPGSWFSFNVNPAPGAINCDLLFSMLVGFDHARACVVHEIGHAVQTRGIPDFIQELANRMHDAPGDTALTQEFELKQYFLNCAEDNCVNRFTQEVGKVFGQDYGYSLNYWYTAIGDVGRRYTHQEPVHLNDTPQERFKNLSFIVSRVFLTNNGLFPATKEGWERIMAIPEWIVGRFRDNPAITLDPEASLQQLLNMCEEVEHYFPQLQELAGGPDHYGQQAEAYARKRFELIHEIWSLYAEDIKNQIIEEGKEDLDNAKDKFNMEMNPSQPPPKKKEKPEQDKEEGEEKENNQENPNPPTQSDKNSDNTSDEELPGDEPDQQPDDSPGGGGEDGDDTSAGADGAAQDSPDDSGDSGDSQDDQSGGNSEPEEGTPPPPKDPNEQPEKDENAGEEQEKEDTSEGEDQAPQEREMEGEPPEDAETKESPEDEKSAEEQDEADSADTKESKESAPEDQETQGMDPAELEKLMQKLMDQFKELVTMKEDENAAPQTIEDDENPEAELLREVEETEPEPPSEEEREDRDGTDQGDAQGGDEFAKGVLESDFLPDEPMASIEDLMKALQESEQQEADRKAAERENREPLFEPEEEKPKVKLEIPPQMSLDQLASGDWDDFTKRVAMHGPVIAMMSKALERLKDAQLKIIFKLSKKHSIIPEGGDLRRFDDKAMQRLFQQLSKAEKFEKDDLAMFKKDGRRAANTRPTRVILIDGSRSMSMGNRPLPMDKAIQEAVIDYMASRVAGYDTYIAMFGPKNPIMLAEPGDHLVEIGKRIEQVHGGLNTMTYLAPALMQVIERIAYRKKFEEPYVGFTNFVIYSDGDIDDAKNAREIIRQIILHAPKSTFDFVLITNKHATPMDVLIRTLEFRNPVHEIGVVRSLSQRSYPLALTSTMKLTQRLGKAHSGFADQAFVRGAQFKRLLAALTRGGDFDAF